MFIYTYVYIGKTVQAIALLQHYRSLWPAMILLPVGLMAQVTAYNIGYVYLI